MHLAAILLSLVLLQPIPTSAHYQHEPKLIDIHRSNADIYLRPKRNYQPNWDSLDARPLPSWYDPAKIGIFIHWGVYAVPSFGTEWFWTNWKNEAATSYVDFMNQNYPPGFTYQQFAPELKAELFNATAWTELFAASGAKYVVLTSKHHDGYSLWPSRYSFGWNSVDVGPHRDVVGELAKAVRADGRMRFGLYHSLFEWFNPMYLADKAAEFRTQEFVEKKIIPEMRELIESYKPDVLWSDGDWEADWSYWNATEFLAWLYNESPVADSVVTNDRWGRGTLCAHGDFYTCQDRYSPGVLQSHKWENAMTLDRRSWGHRTNARLADYLTSAELIGELVRTVSCGGNLLVNVGPNRAGTIEPIFEERLRDMGRWLGVNGEAVYGTKPWRVQNDTHAAGVWYTMTGKEGAVEENGEEVVYAMVLDYPFDGKYVELYSMVDMQVLGVEMLGYPAKLEFVLEPTYCSVAFPRKEDLDKLGLALAWTLKITYSI